MWLVIMGIAAWAPVEAQSFAIASSKFLPVWMAIMLLPILALQIAGRLLSSKSQGDIMDLGMRTGTDFEAVKKLAFVLAWIGGYILSIGVFGMPFASIAFALAFGFSTLKWSWPGRLWALAPGAIIAAIIYGFFEQVMYVDWPKKVVLDLLTF